MSALYPWHHAAWQQLQQARESQHLSHALLFAGEDGCGHEAFVDALAASLLCSHPDKVTGLACGQCRNCQVLRANAHPDFKRVNLLEGKQAILIEQIRELNEFLSLSKSYSQRRVAIIYPAERMNTNAANSLLKSLEEPHEDTHILLLTASPSALLPTIRSRCQITRLPVPTSEQARSWLTAQLSDTTPPDEVLLRLKLASGKPLYAETLNISEHQEQQTQFLDALVQLLRGEVAISHVSQQWEKFDKETFVGWQLVWLQQLIRESLSDAAPVDASLHALKTQLDPHQLWWLHDEMLLVRKLATHPLNARIFVENVLALYLRVSNNKKKNADETSSPFTFSGKHRGST